MESGQDFWPGSALDSLFGYYVLIHWCTSTQICHTEYLVVEAVFFPSIKVTSKSHGRGTKEREREREREGEGERASKLERERESERAERCLVSRYIGARSKFQPQRGQTIWQCGNYNWSSTTLHPVKTPLRTELSLQRRRIEKEGKAALVARSRQSAFSRPKRE